MSRARGLAAIALVTAFVAAGCGGGAKVDDSAGGGGGATTTSAVKADATNAKCTSAKPEATEVGVTPDAIKIAVVADTGSPIRPGLFQGSVDGMKAWADYKNATGGVACRQIEVTAYDSKLSPGDAKNSILAACADTFAMVGTTATFLNDVTPMEQCPDKSGAATGIPDMPVVQTEPVQQCSRVSYSVLPAGYTCPYSGTGERARTRPARARSTTT